MIAVDFSNADIYDVLRRDLCELQIGILVNNEGMTYGYPQYFHENSKEISRSFPLNVNMLSMAVMTHIVLPRMLERNKGYHCEYKFRGWAWNFSFQNILLLNICSLLH